MIPVRQADPAGIAAAVESLRRGKLVLHPTETLVSLTGDPRSGEAARAARVAKGYDRPRPFLCLVPDAAAARRLAGAWPDAAQAPSAFWPGPLTLVVEAAADAPAAVAAGGTIAVRPASDPVSRALLAAWGGALFSTSANRRGEPAPVHVEDAARSLAGEEAVAMALLGTGPAPAGPGLPSTIVDVTGPRPRLARVGAVSAERLRGVVPELTEAGAREGPGEGP